MRRCLFLCLMALSQFGYSQHIIGVGADVNERVNLAQREVLDTSRFQCVYQHLVYEPERDAMRDYYEILLVGISYSKYEDYAAYQLDSLMKTIPTEEMTFNDYFSLSMRYKSEPESLIRDFKSNNMTFYGRVYVDNYIYEEPVPAISWKLEDGTEEVCGYLCHKATATFRGRVWTAWYSDIPINNGPWKFGNLPGLILKLEDAKGDHRFKAVGFKQDTVEFGYQKRDYMKTKRKQYNAALAKYKAEAWNLVENTELHPPNLDGTPVKIPHRKLFYNPIELE